MQTRRDFLSVAGLALPAAFVLPVRGVAAGMPGEGSRRGLFFDSEDLPGLRDRFASDPLFADLRERLLSIDRAAERRFIASEVRLNDQLFDLARLSRTAQQMAFLYAMAGDRDAAALARESIRTILRFPRWDYFLEAGHYVFGLQRAPAAAMAVVLGADWLGDYIDGAERREWLGTMGERGAEPSFRALYGMRYPDRVVGWTLDESSTFFEHRPGERLDLSNWPRILDRTNLKAVPASALAIAAVAYEREFGTSDMTKRWMEQAVFSISTFQRLFEPDGSYEEGISYAGYTALHLAQAVDVLRRHRGIDLYDIINWPGYVRFVREMSLATTTEPGGIVNFGDAWGSPSAAVPFWVAGRSYDGRSQWTGLEIATEYDEWSLIWYRPERAAEPPPGQPHLWRSSLDWMVGRTGYATDDLVVALRSGRPTNHEHADRNGLIVKCYGEPLVADPRGAPYSFSDASWMMRTTAGHSAVLIDGLPHQYHDGREGTNAAEGSAEIVRQVEYDEFFAFTSDATHAYHLVLPDVQSITRTVLILHEFPAVLVVDKVLKGKEPSRIQSRFFAYNSDGQGSVASAADTFAIRRPGAVLQGRSFSPATVVVQAARLPIPEEKAVLHPFIDVGTAEPSLAPLLITVLLPERSPGGDARAEIVPLGEGRYDVRCSVAARRATVRLIDSGAIPEFEVTAG